MYEMKTVTSGLCYIEDLISLENNVVWLWNSLDVQPVDSLVELYNIVLYSRLPFKHFFGLVFGKKCIIQKKM